MLTFRTSILKMSSHETLLQHLRPGFLDRVRRLRTVYR